MFVDDWMSRMRKTRKCMNGPLMQLQSRLLALGCLFVVAALSSSCDGPDRRAAESGKAEQIVAQPGLESANRNQQPVADNPSLDPVPTQENRSQQSGDSATTSKGTIDSGDPAAQSDQSDSQLDRAIDALNQKPIVEHDGRSQPDGPREVREAIAPLVEETWTRLHPAYEIWFDMKNRQVIVGGRICLRDGPLEMFACPEHTKEHESIVATLSDAKIIHAGLLAVGAKVGKPVQWEPKYVPASGTPIDVKVVWMEEGQRRERPAQEMVLDRTTGKHLTHSWVFCGSGRWTDPDTGHSEYFADSGDMICVSNFTTAMMDLTIQSSDLNAELRFNALTDNIPALHTPVLLMLSPQVSGGEMADDPAASGEKSGKEKTQSEKDPAKAAEKNDG